MGSLEDLWGQITRGRMQPLPIIKHLDIFEDAEHQLHGFSLKAGGIISMRLLLDGFHGSPPLAASIATAKGSVH